MITNNIACPRLHKIFFAISPKAFFDFTAFFYFPPNVATTVGITLLSAGLFYLHCVSPSNKKTHAGIQVAAL